MMDGQLVVCGLAKTVWFLADLGLERNPNAEHGLAVWASTVLISALLTLWLATRRGGVLGRLYPSTDTPADPAHGWPFMKRVLLGVAQAIGTVLVIYGLAHILEPRRKTPEGWFLISPPHEAFILARQGNFLWAGGKEGLFALDRRTHALVDLPAVRTRDLRGVRALLVEGNGLWIGCRRGLFYFDQQKLQQVAPPGIQDFGPVNALCRSRDGALWIGGRGGAWRIKDNSWRHFGSPEGLVLPGADVIFQHRDGSLWFGSSDPEAAGLFSMRDEHFINHNQNLPLNAVNNLLEDHAGHLWAATGFGARGGAAQFVNDHWETVAVHGLPGEKIRSLFEDSHHRLWFCSEYSGVSILDGAVWKRLTPRDGLPGAEVKHMLEDEDGTLWLATERGVGCLRRPP